MQVSDQPRDLSPKAILAVLRSKWMPNAQTLKPKPKTSELLESSEELYDDVFEEEDDLKTTIASPATLDRLDSLTTEADSVTLRKGSKGILKDPSRSLVLKSSGKAQSIQSMASVEQSYFLYKGDLSSISHSAVEPCKPVNQSGQLNFSNNQSEIRENRTKKVTFASEQKNEPEPKTGRSMRTIKIRERQVNTRIVAQTSRTDTTPSFDNSSPQINSNNESCSPTAPKTTNQKTYGFHKSNSHVLSVSAVPKPYRPSSSREEPLRNNAFKIPNFEAVSHDTDQESSPNLKALTTKSPLSVKIRTDFVKIQVMSGSVSARNATAQGLWGTFISNKGGSSPIVIKSNGGSSIGSPRGKNMDYYAEMQQRCPAILPMNSNQVGFRPVRKVNDFIISKRDLIKPVGGLHERLQT